MANQKRKRNNNWKLPERIVKVIFSKLSFSDLPNCRIVCKAWNNLVSDFANNNNSCSKSLFHPNAFLACTYDVFPDPRPCSSYTCNPKIHCFDFDTTNSVASLGFDDDCESIVIHGSCNGLLQITLSTSEFDEIVGILNPMTKEFAELSRYDEDYWFGFGFSSKTKQYKLFRGIIPDDQDDELNTTTEVWRFGITNELQQWKPLPSQPTFSIMCDGVYFDGVIYWIGKDIENEFVIYGLDVETEVFETIAILDVGPYSTRYHTYFQQFNATIYLIIKMDAPLLEMQVWIMRAKYSWIKEFVIDLPFDFRSRKFHLIKVFEGEQTLFFLENNDLFYFSKSREKFKIKTLFNPHETKIESIFHMESFHFDSLSKILAGNEIALYNPEQQKG